MYGVDILAGRFPPLIKMSVTRGLTMRRKRGFTLVEILTVTAIVAILAAVSVPAYSRFVERSRRIEGQVLANQIAQAQERHFSTFNRYATSVVGAGLGNLGFLPSCPGGLVGSENCHYTPAVATQNNNQNFTVTVTPVPIVLGGRQTNDNCAALTLTGTGVKAFTGTQTNGKCW